MKSEVHTAVKIDNYEFKTITIAYSLPQGFRAKLEKIIGDYDLFYQIFLENAHPEIIALEPISAFLDSSRTRMIEMKQMIEWSKKWDESV